MCHSTFCGCVCFFNDASRLESRIASAGCLLFGVCSLHFVSVSGIAIVLGAAATSAETSMIASESLAIAVAAAGGCLVLLSLFGSILDQHRSAAARIEADRLGKFAAHSHEGMIIHRDGIILDINLSMARIIGNTPDQVIGTHVRHLTAPNFHGLIEARMKQPYRLRSSPENRIEMKILGAHGQDVPVEIASYETQFDGAPAVLVIVHDLSARKEAEARIKTSRQYDHATALPNRFLFDEKLHLFLEQAQESDGMVTLLRFDLDSFHAIGAKIGHHGADKVAAEIAERLRYATRSVDVAARLSAREFALIQPFADGPDQVAEFAERMSAALSKSVTIGALRVDPGVSIGIAIFPLDGKSAKALLQSADAALHRGKGEGPGKVVFFDPRIDASYRSRRHLEDDLRHAAERGELELHYQPVVDLSTGYKVAFEALLHWNHPTQGVLHPADFIPIAADAGISETICAWVLEAACSEAVSWPAPYDVAVNLSPFEFQLPDLPYLIASILTKSGLPANRLQLNVTEGALLDDTEAAFHTLRALQGHGIRIALDDFGTGYSSLTSLYRFSFDRIRIDQSLLRTTPQAPKNGAILGAIIAAGHHLQISVTAKGVETEDQLEFLRNERCDQVQGSLLGCPMSRTALTHRIQDGVPVIALLE
jgi:diguanylate cyclase